MTEDHKECGWNNNGNCLAYPDMCAEIDDCEHKQLKRLEQENKELKELNKKICEDWEKEIKVYWNALEEIREVIYYCGYKDVVDKVLPKINEVLNLS